MKKLMVAFAAVALGVTAQAASVAWQATVYEGGEPSDYAYLVNKDGNLVTSMEPGYSIVLAVVSGDFSGDEWSVTKELQTASIGEDSSVGNTLEFSYDAKPISNNDVLAAILKDKDGNYSKIQYYDGGDVNETFVVSGLNDGLYSGEFHFAQSGNVLNVPEPTSGLLLLLGMAGLALRRRRA